METILIEPSKHVRVFNAIKKELSQGLIAQNYCNAVLVQPKVDFSTVSELKDLQDSINNTLSQAQKHAKDYLSNVSSPVVRLLPSLEHYFTQYASIPIVLPEGSTEEEWIQGLIAVKSISEKNEHDIDAILPAMERLIGDFKGDSINFSDLAFLVNEKLSGDSGELVILKKDLDSIDLQIAGSGVAIAFGSLAVVGGVFMIVVGAVADFVTAGTNPEFVISGVVAVVAGVGAVTGAAISLRGALEQKWSLLAKQTSLNAEVALITGIGTSLNSLSVQANEAYEALRQLKQTWTNISNHIGELTSDLKSGVLTAGEIRTMFLTEANDDIVKLQEDIHVIKEQITGVEVKKLTTNESLLTYVDQMILN